MACREGAPIQPGVKVALDRIQIDPRNEPQYGERIPYDCLSFSFRDFISKKLTGREGSSFMPGALRTRP